jgi:hypothetical protein
MTGSSTTLTLEWKDAKQNSPQSSLYCSLELNLILWWKQVKSWRWSDTTKNIRPFHNCSGNIHKVRVVSTTRTQHKDFTVWTENDMATPMICKVRWVVLQIINSHLIRGEKWNQREPQTKETRTRGKGGIRWNKTSIEIYSYDVSFERKQNNISRKIIQIERTYEILNY